MSEALESLVTGLRAWSRDHDAPVRAAVELLIWHEGWLRRQDFTRACVRSDSSAAWITWRHAREFADSGPRASTTELAVLDLAVALGENRYRLSSMGAAHRRAIAHAVAAAVGLADPAEWPRG